MKPEEIVAVLEQIEKDIELCLVNIEKNGYNQYTLQQLKDVHKITENIKNKTEGIQEELDSSFNLY